MSIEALADDVWGKGARSGIKRFREARGVAPVPVLIALVVLGAGALIYFTVAKRRFDRHR